MDPIGAIPVFVIMTARHSPSEQNSIIHRALLTTLAVLAFFGFAHAWIFNFLGFTMGAFRAAGGFFLFFLAFEMLMTRSTWLRRNTSENEGGISKIDIAITPLAIPLLAGPATITAVVLAFSKAQGYMQNIIIAIALIMVCATTWVLLRIANRIHNYLGQSGTKVVTSMMGLILGAIAVQFMAEGLLELFPALGHHF